MHSREFIDHFAQCRYADRFIHGTYSEKGDDVIFSDGLQQSRGAGQRLKARATRGEKRSNHYDPWGGPCECAYDQVPFHGVSKPVGKTT